MEGSRPLFGSQEPSVLTVKFVLRLAGAPAVFKAIRSQHVLEVATVDLPFADGPQVPSQVELVDVATRADHSSGHSVCPLRLVFSPSDRRSSVAHSGRNT